MGGRPSSAGSTWRMPTKSKKRRPKKDGHVSYQQVSLAQPNVVLREVDYIVELLLGAIRGSSRSDSCCSPARRPVTHGCSIPRIIWRCVRPRLAAASLSQIVETVTRYAIEWTASYRFEGNAFVVTDESGQRVILGYPVRELVQAEQRAAR